jgi:hypothetical protein
MLFRGGERFSRTLEALLYAFKKRSAILDARLGEGRGAQKDEEKS